MDELGYYLYQHGKNTIIELPPTSRATRGNILKAFYATHLQLHCLDNPNIVSPDFDFKQNNGTLQPDRLQALLPEDCLCYKALSTYKFKI